MKAVVDTNVIAYHLLQTERFAEECKRFWQAVEEPVAPASWEAELVNVLWLMARQNVVTLSDALHLLDVAESLAIRSIPIGELWHGALTRGHVSGITAYDAMLESWSSLSANPSHWRRSTKQSSRPSRVWRCIPAN